MSKLQQTAAGGGRFLSLAVLAIILLGFAAPAHATDNTVELTIGSDANLKPSAENATLYKATTPVKIKTAKPYGFNLTIRANSSDLINSLDNSHRISGGEYSPQFAYVYRGLNSDMWGYQIKEDEDVGLSEYPNSYLRMPSGNEPSNVLIDTDVEGKRAGCKRKDVCEINMVFGANLNSTKLAAGSYSTTITYTATAKPKPAPTVDPTTCKSGDPKNDCQVDLDPNMIPVKYTGTTTNAQWTSLKNPEDRSNQGNWYNYNNKQWANAVTVKDPSKYQNQTRVVDQADILGFWVYIPRYAYEVMRRDGTDKPVSAQNFLIQFEKTTTPKRVPAACPEQGKDYRTQCGLDRSYIKGQPSNQGTWATHPAFTFGSKELNGIWFAKFETTGTSAQPTILPNERHIPGGYIEIYSIYGTGGFYTVAKSLGINDPQNVGGKSVSTSQNSHHLAKLSSHMVNNNDWGAATYLSASKYGAGYNGVQVNTNDANHNDSYGTTGCGPQASGNTDSYSNSGTLGTQQACSSIDSQRAYNGTLGQLASTTNNPTGIYDMSGGGGESVAASYSDNLNNSNTNNYFGSNAAHPPYVNTYNFEDFSSCTYQTCGGQALYETNNGSSTGTNMWLNQTGSFVEQDSSHYSSPWFYRGGSCGNGLYSGLFFVGNSIGDENISSAFRVVLAPAP